MILPDPPRPRLWKAWLITLPLCALVAWSISWVAHIPAAVLWGGTLVISFAFAYFVNDRMQNDWRASDTMHARTFDYRTRTGRERGLRRP